MKRFLDSEPAKDAAQLLRWTRRGMAIGVATTVIYGLTIDPTHNFITDIPVGFFGGGAIGGILSMLSQERRNR